MVSSLFYMHVILINFVCIESLKYENRKLPVLHECHIN